MFEKLYLHHVLASISHLHPVPYCCFNPWFLWIAGYGYETATSLVKGVQDVEEYNSFAVSRC